uniref:Ubiquitin-protein ligase n=1 Tax=Solanum tuberosum TaxID=4113 RepID=M1DY56_SOLTU
MEGKKRPPSSLEDTQSNRKRCRISTTTKEDAVAHGFVDDMVFEILTWVAAKSLMRFKCVSKAWNSLILHDFNFVKLHIARSRDRPLATRLLYEIGLKTPHIPQHYLNATRRVTYNQPPLELFPLQLVGSRNYFDYGEIFICSNHCNGLVCLYNGKDSQGFLYNITTGEIKALPFSLGYTRIGDRPELYLGYDPATERYKLLRDRIYYKKRPCIKILTLGTNNSWRRLCENSPGRLNNLSSGRTFVNGVLYWANPKFNSITYFNLTEEKFGTLSPPERSRVSEIQSALWGKLIVYPRDQPENCNLVVYDEVNKVFTKFDSDPDLMKEKFVVLEAENIEKRRENEKYILATSSLTSTYLVFAYHFWPRYVSRFVENIIPLSFIIDV